MAELLKLTGESTVNQPNAGTYKWTEHYQLVPPVSADDVTEFCRYLECKFGSEIRYEHSKEQRLTSCRFKLVGTLSLTKIRIEIVVSFIAPWEGHTQSCTAEISLLQSDRIVDISPEQRTEIFNGIRHEINAANSSQYSNGELFTVIQHFVASPRALLNTPVRILDNITALPTVLYEDGSLPVGAIKRTIRSLSGTLAVNDTIAAMNRAMDVIVLALGAQENWRGQDRGIPSNCRQPSVLPGTVRSLRRIYASGYQPGSSMPGLYEQSQNNTDKLAKLAAMLRCISDDEDIWAALAAYRDGTECLRQGRALSVVAYMAALAALCTKQMCPGKVNCECEICGSLEYRHEVVGERKAIENLVIEAHSSATDTTKDRLCLLIKEAHRSIRSRYVHTAAPKLETGRFGDLVNGLIRPGPTARIVPELDWQVTLGSFQSIARQTILWVIAQKAGASIDPDFWQLGSEQITEITSTIATRLTNGEDWLYIRGYN